MEYLYQLFRKPQKKKVAFADLVLTKLNQLIKQGDRLMTEIDELKVAFETIAADQLAIADLVKVAMDRMSQMNNSQELEGMKKAVAEATQSLAASHLGLDSTLTGLKAKLEEVSASNGDAG